MQVSFSTKVQLSFGRMQLLFEKLVSLALVGVAQWIECQPANQRVAGSMPSQGTCCLLYTSDAADDPRVV